MFANGPEEKIFTTAKESRMVLDSTLLNTKHYKVRISDKVDQSREKNSAFPYIST